MSQIVQTIDRQALAEDMARLIRAKVLIVSHAKELAKTANAQVKDERKEKSFYTTRIEVVIGKLLDGNTPNESLAELRSMVASDKQVIDNLVATIEAKIGSEMEKVKVQRQVGRGIQKFVDQRSENFNPADESRIAEVLAELERQAAERKAQKEAEREAKRQEREKAKASK